MARLPRRPPVCWVEGTSGAESWPGAVEIDRSEDGGWRLTRMPRLAEFGDDPGMDVHDQAGVADFLASRERQYRATGNPAFVWLAYGFCRTSGVPLPQWVLEYLDGCYEGIEQAIFRHEAKGEPAASVAAKIGAIFGFKSGRGRRNWISEVSGTMSAIVLDRLWQRGQNRRHSGLGPGKMLEIGREILAEESVNGGKRGMAAVATAEKRGVSITTARKARAQAVKHRQMGGCA